MTSKRKTEQGIEDADTSSTLRASGHYMERLMTKQKGKEDDPNQHWMTLQNVTMLVVLLLGGMVVGVPVFKGLQAASESLLQSAPGSNYHALIQAQERQTKALTDLLDAVKVTSTIQKEQMAVLVSPNNYFFALASDFEKRDDLIQRIRWALQNDACLPPGYNNNMVIEQWLRSPYWGVAPNDYYTGPMARNPIDCFLGVMVALFDSHHGQEANRRRPAP